MRKAVSLLLLLAVCLSLPAVQANDFRREVIIWVEGTIHVDVETGCDETIETVVGEPGDCSIKIINSGNIEDTLKLEGRMIPDDDRGWVDFHFECDPESPGDCSSDYSYSDSHYPPEVRNIVLSPDVPSATVYLVATPYKVGTSEIEVTGYSLTNQTEQEFVTITLEANPEESSYGAFTTPGLSNWSLVLLFVLSGAVFWAAKFR